jgi:hypothetical protein
MIEKLTILEQLFDALGVLTLVFGAYVLLSIFPFGCPHCGLPDPMWPLRVARGVSDLLRGKSG